MSTAFSQNILTPLSIFIITQGISMGGGGTSEAFHTCRGWKGHRVQQKHSRVQFFSFFLFAGYHYSLWDSRSDTAAALNNGDVSCHSRFPCLVKGPEDDQIYIQSLIYILTSHSALVWIINATRSAVRRGRVKMRDGGEKACRGTKCKGEPVQGSEGKKEIVWALRGSIKYFNHRLSLNENAFDPDSKGLLQNKRLFELAAAQ